jgi:hypothetical protein
VSFIDIPGGRAIWAGKKVWGTRTRKIAHIEDETMSVKQRFHALMERRLEQHGEDLFGEVMNANYRSQQYRLPMDPKTESFVVELLPEGAEGVNMFRMDYGKLCERLELDIRGN